MWDFVDGGFGDKNSYGDVMNDGSGLTRKGRLHAARANKGSRISSTGP